MTESALRIDCDGKTVGGLLLTTSSTPTRKRGAVIAYGSDGFRDGQNGPWKTMILGYGRELVARGFTVAIPDYLGYTDTRPGPDVFLNFHELPRWQRVLECTVSNLRASDRSTPVPVALLGFSLGGHLCLRARATTTVLVEFFAPQFPELGGIGSRSTLQHALIHHGTADAVVTVSNADQIAGVLQSEGVNAQLIKHVGANHGFVGSDPANTAARDDAFQKTVAFLDAHT